MELTVSTADLERHGIRLERTPAIFNSARRAMINNMAFGVRETCLEWGIPRIMTVRNPALLKVTLRVTKAISPGYTATLGMTTRDRFGGLLEEEIGGTIKRQPATLAAREGNASKTIPNRFRLRGDFLSPEDIDVANDRGGWGQRITAFISQLERQNYSKPFVMHGYPLISSGLMVFGKRIKGARFRQSGRAKGAMRDLGRHGYGLKRAKARTLTRQLITLRPFTKGQTQIKKRQWMKPSIDRWLATHNRQVEWKSALDFILSRAAK